MLLPSLDVLQPLNTYPSLADALTVTCVPAEKEPPPPITPMPSQRTAVETETVTSAGISSNHAYRLTLLPLPTNFEQLSSVL